MRTLDEIQLWATLPDGGKRRVWAELERRARRWDADRACQPDPLA